MSENLLGVTEIAELLGVTRQRVHQLRQLEDFPRPTATIAAGAIWLREDVEQWARETGRLS